MNKLLLNLSACLVVLVLAVPSAYAQYENDMGTHSEFLDTRTMNFPLSDAAPMMGSFAEFGTNYYSYQFEDALHFQLRGEWAPCEHGAFGLELGYSSFMPESDLVDNQSGLMDPRLGGWYSFFRGEDYNTALGGWFSLPVGSEDIGQGNFDFGAFGTLRYTLGENLLGVGQLGFESLDPVIDNFDRETLFLAQGSLIYRQSDSWDFFAETRIQQDPDYSFRPGSFSYLKAGARHNFASSLDLGLMVGTRLGDYGASPFVEFKVGKSFSGLFGY